MEKTLNDVLSTVQQITKRLDSIEEKLEKFDNRIVEIDNKYATICTELESNISSLDSNTKQLENSTAVLESAMTANCNNLNERLNECVYQINCLRKENNARESYSKRLNILIHGVDELKEVAVETKKQTKEIFEQFLGNALEIQIQKGSKQ